MSDISYFTKEGLEKFKAELNELKTKGRSDMAKQIAEAREKGDLSENAEYDAAKDAQGLLELKISQLEAIMATARIIDESQIDLTQVSIMTTVKLKNLKNKKEVAYTLVSEKEADLKQKKISVKSPIGSSLLGKKIGEIVDVKVPSGTIQFEVMEISLK